MTKLLNLLKSLKSRWLASWDIALTGVLFLAIFAMLFYTLSPHPLVTLELDEIPASAYVPAIDPVAVETSVPAPPRTGRKAPEVVAAIPLTVNINKATPSELERLPGIGPKLAARIIAFREQHGRLNAPEDLLGVSGIGPKSLEKLRPYLTVD